MPKRGRYIIHTAATCVNQFAGKSWSERNGPPTLKEFLSNEIHTRRFSTEPGTNLWGYVAQPQLSLIGNAWLLWMNHEGCDITFADWVAPGNYFPEELWEDGVPWIDVYNILTSKIIELNCMGVPDWSSPNHILLSNYFRFSGYETTNFKKFLMSRGFDVEIYDPIDLMNMGAVGDTHKDLIIDFHGNILHNPMDVEYVLLVGSASDYEWNPNVQAPNGYCDCRGGEYGYEPYEDLPWLGNDCLIEGMYFSGTAPTETGINGGNVSDIHFQSFNGPGPNKICRDSWNGKCSVDTNRNCFENEDCPEEQTCNWAGPVYCDTSMWDYTSPCAGNCSTTTGQGCFEDEDCPGGETCENSLGMCTWENYQTGKGTKWSIPFANIGRVHIKNRLDLPQFVLNNIEYHTSGMQRLCWDNPIECYGEFGIVDALPYGLEMGLEPGHQHENFLNFFGIQSGATGLRSSDAGEVGFDREEPNTTNPDLLARYHSIRYDYEHQGDAEMIELFMEIEEDNLNRSIDEPRDDCPEGEVFDPFSEECIPSEEYRVVQSPYNSTKWLQRRLDDMGYNAIVSDEKGALTDFMTGYGLDVTHGRTDYAREIGSAAVTNYRGAASSHGMNLPYIKLDSWCPGCTSDNSQFTGRRAFFPTYFLGWVCDLGDWDTSDANGKPWTMHYMMPHKWWSIAESGQGWQYFMLPTGFVGGIAASEINTEAKYNNILMANFWHYMFGEINPLWKNQLQWTHDNSSNGWETSNGIFYVTDDKEYDYPDGEIIRNQEVGYALSHGRYSWFTELGPVISPSHDTSGCSYGNCNAGGSTGHGCMYASYNIFGDPSLAFYIGKPKKMIIDGILYGQTITDNELQINVYGIHELNPLDHVVASIILDNGGWNELDQILLKSYSNEQGEVNFDLTELPDEAVGVPLELHINRYQHWPEKISFSYEGA